ncbi:MAG: SPOR domain-containing protein [Bacteroidia bacterium]|nr:SPOR domain-containing protein [Bacteroidia bacterium]
MRHYFKIATLLVLSVLFVLNGYAQANRTANTYFKGTIDQMRQQAKSLQKPYILFFHAEWSDPSKDVELNCIKNVQIKDLLQREFLLYKVEMDSRSTNAPVNQLAQFYKVSLYPTFIFFAPDGFILKKMAGQVNVQSFGDELNSVRELSMDRQESNLNGEMGEGEWIPEDFFEDDDTPPSKSKPSKPKKNEPDWAGLIEDEKAKPKPKVQPKKSQSDDYLEGPSEMFAIQLGAYTKMANAQNKLDEVMADSNFPAEIREIYVKGVKYYKVIIGPYASKAKAEQQRVQVARELRNNGSFIIKIPRY